jgi:hypothetical protein
MKLDLNAIETAAKAATPGPWVALESGRSGRAFIRAAELEGMRTVVEEVTSDRAMGLPDAAHCAATSPDVALALVARLRAAEALLDIGLMRCDRFVHGLKPTRGMIACDSFAVAVDHAGKPVCAAHDDRDKPQGEGENVEYLALLRAWLALRSP